MSSESPSERYLKLAFQLNPMWQSKQIIDLRARVLRVSRLDKCDVVADQVDLASLRSGAKQQIAEIQANFWQLHLDSLKRHLEIIDVQRLPDLAPVVGRLRTAAACRGEFPKLAQETWMELKLFNAFKSAVVLPPAEAGYARESFLARIQNPKELKRIKHAVRKLQTNYPILFSMEEDWFQSLLKHKIRNVDGEYSDRAAASFSLPEMGWPAWLALFFLIRLVIRLLSMSGGN